MPDPQNNQDGALDQQGPSGSLSPSAAFHGEHQSSFGSRRGRSRYQSDEKSQPKNQQQQDDLPNRIQKLYERGPQVHVRTTSVTMDESSFAAMVRIDTIIALRGRIGDDAFVLNEIERIFKQNFSRQISD